MPPPAQTNQSTGGNAVIPTLPPTITSSALTSQSPISIPQQPAVNTGATANASIPSPVPTASSLIAQDSATTPAQQQQSSIEQQLASLIGGQSSLATQQMTKEGAAGVPALTKSVNDLTVQLSGLNDQATALQNAAAPGGAIQNTEQNNAQGRGITAGGLAPLTAADLRNNQIQQSTIASQALTVKSALFAAQGNLTLAKNAADQAAQVAFDADTQKINYQKALLDAIAPQLSKDEKMQAAQMQADLQDRQNQIQVQQDNFKTGQAAIADAMKNNPNDHSAQYAAQQAMQLDPHDPQYLQKVQSLVAPYATDLAARALDQQLKQAQISEANASAAKTRADTGGTNSSGAASTTIQDNSGNSVAVPINVAPYVSFSNSGIKYADLSTVQGTASEKAAIVNQAQAAGIKVITNKNTALDLTNIGDANSKLDTISTIMAGIDQPSALSRDLAGIGLTKLATMAQSNPQQAAAGALQGVGLDILKAISGVQGFRGNSSVVQQITDHLPSIYDSNKTVQDKISYIRALIDDRENKILGQQGTNSGGGTITAGGKQFVIGQVYQDSSGAKWVTDANGKWTKQ